MENNDFTTIQKLLKTDYEFFQSILIEELELNTRAFLCIKRVDYGREKINTVADLFERFAEHSDGTELSFFKWLLTIRNCGVKTAWSIIDNLNKLILFYGHQLNNYNG